MSAFSRGLAIKLVVTCATLAVVAGVAGLSACGPGQEEPAPEPVRYNLLVLAPDTVRADHLGINGYARDTTPRIDALARDGINFRNARTVAPRTWQSFSSILTGLYPPNHGVRYIYDEPIAADTPTLGSVLRDRGYATAAFDIIPFLKGMTGGHGFERFVLPGKTDAEHSADERTIENVAEWVAETGERPWLAFVRMSGGHWPYTQGDRAHAFSPCDDCSHAFNHGRIGVARGEGHEGFVLSDREAYRRLIWELDPDERSRAHRIAHYDAELYATDALIGGLLDTLQERGELDRTVVIVTSDHGESFGEHGYLQHGPRVDETVMRVPLVVWLPPGHPARAAGTERDELVRVIDVLPTALDALGVAPPPGLDGRSLLPDSPGEPASAYGEAGRSFMGTDPERHYAGVRGKQRMLQHGRWKLVYTPGPDGGRAVLFDVQADPDERNDLAGQHPDLRTDLLDALRAIDAGGDEDDEPALSEEQKERLRALGYMQ